MCYEKENHVAYTSSGLYIFSASAELFLIPWWRQKMWFMHLHPQTTWNKIKLFKKKNKSKWSTATCEQLLEQTLKSEMDLMMTTETTRCLGYMMTQ